MRTKEKEEINGKVTFYNKIQTNNNIYYTLYKFYLSSLLQKFRLVLIHKPSRRCTQ